MTPPSIHHLSYLHGHEIVRWVGTEMAVVGGGESKVWSESESQWKVEHEKVEWSHPSVPYLQFTSLDIQLANGKTLRLLSQLEDQTGFHGLHLIEVEEVSEPSAEEEWSIFRTREVAELPVGSSKVDVCRQDGPSAVIEASISIDSHTIKLLAAEVHPRMDGQFDIVEGDESILIQLDDARPNPSIEGTSSSKLRLPPAAPHVKR